MNDPNNSHSPSAPPRRRKRPPQNGGMSDQSKKIGFIVLGLGILAVTGTILLALYMRSGDAPSEPTPKQIEAQEKEEMKDSLETMKSAPTPAPIPEEKEETIDIDTDRPDKIKESDIKGMWQAPVNGGKAVLQIQDGVYRLIISFKNKNLERRYSNGTYKIVKDILILNPRSDWGPPEEKKNSGLSNYRSLTGSEFPVLVSIQKGKLVWRNAGEATDMPPDIYVPNVNPFLTLTDKDVAVWDTLN